MRWVKNTSGKKDAMLTFAVIGFIVVILKLLFAGNSVVVGDNLYTFGTLSASEIAAILIPTFGAYVVRRYTDSLCEEFADSEE